MSKKTKALLYNFLCFAAIYMLGYFLISNCTNLKGLWIPITAAVIGTILAPKFQAIKTNAGEKIFMKWIFIKEVKEIG